MLRTAALLKSMPLLGTFGALLLLVACGDDNETAENGLAFTPSIVSVTATPLAGVSPLEVTFQVSVEDADIVSATWEFGDGGFAQTTDGTVSHKYSTSGKFNGRVQLNTDSRVIADRDLESVLPEIDVAPDVNLIVSSFAIDREVTPGEWETVSAVIQNIGSETLEGKDLEGLIHVGYYLSTDAVITVDDIYIGDTSILLGTFFANGDLPFSTQKLSPGENYTYDHQLAVKGNVPPGTYYAGAIVDYIDEYYWYDFPRATDTREYVFPSHIVVPESNEQDNVRLLDAYQVIVQADPCTSDAFEDDDDSTSATTIALGEAQLHNFCRDNSDWLKFEATQGNIYKITTSNLGLEADTQLILFDTDAASILLFHDNIGNVTGGTGSESCTRTADLDAGWPGPPCGPSSEIVWEAQQSGTYYIKVRTTACDEDINQFCRPDASWPLGSPDGVGLKTEYTITLQ